MSEHFYNYQEVVEHLKVYKAMLKKPYMSKDVNEARAAIVVLNNIYEQIRTHEEMARLAGQAPEKVED